MRGMCDRGMPPPSSLILITTSSLFSPSAMITCAASVRGGTISAGRTGTGAGTGAGTGRRR